VPHTWSVASSEKQPVEVGLLLFKEGKWMTLTKQKRNWSYHYKRLIIQFNIDLNFGDIMFYLRSFKAGHKAYLRFFCVLFSCEGWGPAIGLSPVERGSHRVPRVESILLQNLWSRHTQNMKSFYLYGKQLLSEVSPIIKTCSWQNLKGHGHFSASRKFPFNTWTYFQIKNWLNT